MFNFAKVLKALKGIAPAAAGAGTVAGISALDPEEAESWPRAEIADILRTLAKRGAEFDYFKSLGFPKDMTRHISPTADMLSAMESSHADKAYDLLKKFAEGSKRKLSVRAGSWADPSVHAVGAKIAPVYVEATGAVQSPLKLGAASHEVGHGLSADKASKLKMAAALPREEQNRLVAQMITDNLTSEKSEPVRALGDAILASFKRKKGMLRAEGKAAGYEKSGLSEFDTELVANGFEYEQLKNAGGTMSPASLISYARKSKDPAIRAAFQRINELEPEYLKAAAGYDDASFGTKVAESLKGKGKRLIKASATLGGPGVLMAAQEGEKSAPGMTTLPSSTQGLLTPGNIDLTKQPVVQTAKGPATVRSMSFNEDGVEILVPTVAGGRELSEQEAIDEYHRTGKHLGKFTNPATATQYSTRLHQAYQSGQIPGYKGQLDEEGNMNKATTPEEFDRLVRGDSEKATTPEEFDRLLAGTSPVTGATSPEEFDRLLAQGPREIMPVKPSHGIMPARSSRGTVPPREIMPVKSSHGPIPLQMQSAHAELPTTVLGAPGKLEGAPFEPVNVGKPTRIKESAVEEYSRVAPQRLKESLEGLKKIVAQNEDHPAIPLRMQAAHGTPPKAEEPDVTLGDRGMGALEAFSALDPVITPIENLTIQGINNLLGKGQDIREVLRMEDETQPTTGLPAADESIRFASGFIPIGGWGSKASKAARIAKRAAKIAEASRKAKLGLKVGEGVAAGVKELTASERLIQIAQAVKAEKLAGSEELASRIKALYEAGHGQESIATQLGIGRQIVRDHITRMGIPPRTAVEGRALAQARQIPRTPEELRAARLGTFKKSDRLRRKIEKGLDLSTIEGQQMRSLWKLTPEGGLSPEDIERVTRRQLHDNILALPEGQRKAAEVRLFADMLEKAGVPSEAIEKALIPGAEALKGMNRRERKLWEAVQKATTLRRLRSTAGGAKIEEAELAAKLSSPAERGSEYLLGMADDAKSARLTSEARRLQTLTGKAPDLDTVVKAGGELAEEALEQGGLSQVELARVANSLGVFSKKSGTLTKPTRTLGEKFRGSLIARLPRIIQSFALSSGDNFLAANGGEAVSRPITAAFRKGQAFAQQHMSILDNIEKNTGIQRYSKYSEELGKAVRIFMEGGDTRNIPVALLPDVQKWKRAFEQMDKTFKAGMIYRAKGSKNILPGDWDKYIKEADALLGEGKGSEYFAKSLSPHLREGYLNGTITDVYDQAELFMQAFRRVDTDLPAVIEARKALEALPENIPPALRQLLQSTGKRFLQTYLGGGEYVPEWMEAGRAINALYYRAYIGANVTSAATNLMQSLNTMVQTGVGNTLKGLIEAVDDIARNPKQFFLSTKFDRIDDALYKTGMFLDMPGIEAASSLAQAGKTMKTVDQALMYAFSRAEWINRKIAFRAGWHEAVKMGLKEESKIIDHALDVVHKTQFTYGRSSPVGLSRIPALGTFMTYPGKQAEFIFSNIIAPGFNKLGKDGWKSRNSPEVLRLRRLAVLLGVGATEEAYRQGTDPFAAIAGFIDNMSPGLAPGLQDIGSLTGSVLYQISIGKYPAVSPALYEGFRRLPFNRLVDKTLAKAGAEGVVGATRKAGHAIAPQWVDRPKSTKGIGWVEGGKRAVLNLSPIHQDLLRDVGHALYPLYIEGNPRKSKEVKPNQGKQGIKPIQGR